MNVDEGLVSYLKFVNALKSTYFLIEMNQAFYCAIIAFDLSKKIHNEEREMKSIQLHSMFAMVYER